MRLGGRNDLRHRAELRNLLDGKYGPLSPAAREYAQYAYAAAVYRTDGRDKAVPEYLAVVKAAGGRLNTFTQQRAAYAAAHERGMGIAAMKVVGAGMLGAWAPYVVPEFDKARLAGLPGAAIRWVLQDERIDLLVIGMRVEKELEANLRTLGGNPTYTLQDRALLTEFMARAYDSDAVRKMRVD